MVFSYDTHMGTQQLLRSQVSWYEQHGVGRFEARFSDGFNDLVPHLLKFAHHLYIALDTWSEVQSSVSICLVLANSIGRFRKSHAKLFAHA